MYSSDGLIPRKDLLGNETMIRDTRWDLASAASRTDLHTNTNAFT